MIVLKVNGREFKYFSNVNVDLAIDTIASSFNFSGFFNNEDEELRKIFKPLTYLACEIWFIDNDKNIREKLITGTIINVALSTQRQERLMGVSGYSKTGILEDVNMPLELYPLQFDGLGLDQIIKNITDYFGLQLKINENAKIDAAKPFEKVKAEPSEKIKGFISKIARQRNMTVTHDNFGRLLLYKILDVSPPKIRINEDDIKVTSVSVTPNGQGIHSSITVIKQSSTGDQNEGESTVISPFVKNQKRPLVKMLSNGENEDTNKAAKAIASSEAKNFPITIELEGWTFQDKIVRAGFYIELTAPSIFLSRTKLVLQRVSFKDDPKKGKTQTLTAVLPCVYTGELPAKSPFI